jgi:diacylglycerol kinase (ATP)
MPEIKNQKILFIINPRSGNKSKENLPELISKKGIEHGFHYSILETNGVDDKNLISNQIEIQNPDIVAVIGGDGTCHTVCEIIKDTQIPMAIIPSGSANGLAADLGIPKEPDLAIDIITKGDLKKIDLIRLNNSHFCMHLSDVGLNAKLVHRFEQENKRGLFSYARHLLRELFIFRKYRFKITIDGQTFKRTAVSLTFANSCRFGSGAIINPCGKINDGQFEICIIKPFPWYYIIPITIQFFRGTLNNSKYVEIHSCKSAVIKSKKPVLLQTDGEIAGYYFNITAEIKPLSLNLIVPNNLKVIF